jgi:hypothetical protein
LTTRRRCRAPPGLLFPLALGPLAQVFYIKRERLWRVNDLNRVPVRLREGGAQRLVPSDDFGERRLQGGDVNAARHAHGEG